MIRRNDTNEQHGKEAYDRKEIYSEFNRPVFKRGVLLEGFRGKTLVRLVTYGYRFIKWYLSIMRNFFRLEMLALDMLS